MTMKTRTIFILIFTYQLSFGHPGIGLVEDSRGNIYYTDLAQVWKVTPTGARSVVVAHVHTHELYLDENDNLFGEHLWYNGDTAGTWGHFVWKLTRSGDYRKIVPDTQGFRDGYSFVRDHLGRNYSADRSHPGCQHIIRRSRDGKKDMTSAGCLLDIRWMTVDPSGNVLLIDRNDLKKISDSGAVTTVATQISEPKASQPTVNEPHYLSAVTVDALGNIYIADYSGRQVKRIDDRGQITIVYRSAIPWSPTALVVAKNGDFLVTENSAANTVRFVRVPGYR